jgi:hypothetical protein
MDDAAVESLKPGDRIISHTGNIRTVLRTILSSRGRMSRVYLTKLVKVKPGILQIEESCIERWALKNRYKLYDRS